MVRSFLCNPFNNTVKDIRFITLIYTITFSIILLNHGIFWDDWVLDNQESYLRIAQFAQAGGFINTGYLHSFIFSFNNAILLYRVITFLSYLIVTLLFFKVLGNIKQIDRFSRFYIIIIFAIFPVNFARIAAINVPYSIFLCLFMLGFVIVDFYINKPNLILRLISLVLFFLSFQVGSILFFYATVLLYLFSTSFNTLKYPTIKFIRSRIFINWLLKYSDYLLLPFIYWILKSIFASPTGLYEGYNAVTLEGLLYDGPLLSIRSIITSFVEPIIYAFTPEMPIVSISTYLSVLLMIAVLFSILIKRMFRNELSSNCFKKNLSQEKHMIVLGFFLFLLAVYPYAVVGRLPQLYNWESRHQILVPFGASFIIYYGVKLICREFKKYERAFWLLSSFIIILFIFCNINVYLEYQKDWYKQLSLMEAFQQNKYMQNPGTFYFIDASAIKNARNRTYRFYEYSGMFKKTFGDETRMGLDYEQKGKLDSLVKYFQPYYHLSHYAADSPEYIVTIRKGTININSTKVFLTLMYNQLMNHNKFMNYITEIVEIDVNPIDEGE